MSLDILARNIAWVAAFVAIAGMAASMALAHAAVMTRLLHLMP